MVQAAPQTVDLVDARAAGQKLGRHRLKIGEADAGDGRRHQGRAAAGDQTKQKIGPVEPGEKPADFIPGGDAPFVRNRMSAFDDRGTAGPRWIEHAW